jgi:predicted O-methyltransferase YrrM
MTRRVFSPPKLIEDARSRLLAAKRFDAGRVGPPADRAKRRHLLDLFREREHRIFVESGTYLGDTVAAFLPHAGRIFSVEIDPRLHGAAAARFAGEPQVEIILGTLWIMFRGYWPSWPSRVRLARRPLLGRRDGKG